MIRLICDKDEWCRVVESASHADFYHTYDYHRLSSQEDEHPVLVEYSEGDQRIALPLLFRVIPGTDLKDATSVYGYPGPLGIKLRDDFDNESFRDELIEFFNWNNVISVFSRLNPFIPRQSQMLKGLGEISSPGKVVYLNLKKSSEQLWSDYSRRMRTYINKSRRQYNISEADSQEDIREFISSYHAKMKRVEAHPRYFFQEKYFFELLKSQDFQAKLLIAKRKLDDSFAGGALFVSNKHIVQYHLSGAKDDAMHLNPIKMLIDEMRLQATREGFNYLNLGGGVGNLEDSLFHFKASFSKEFQDFNLWKFKVNQEKYDELSRESKAAKYGVTTDKCAEFFPYYRCDK